MDSQVVADENSRDSTDTLLYSDGSPREVVWVDAPLTTEQCSQWLCDIGLPQHSHTFLAADICEEVIYDLSRKDCEELGLTADDYLLFTANLKILHAQNVRQHGAL
mmetsp:Transcript_41728/g.85322  ORF Transcript_41728/g.85322 Transcript_41728/m.85322 type:complete len:106 (-) Transcript_41728:239-556(-)